MFSKDPGEKPVEAPAVWPPHTAPSPCVAATLDPGCGGGPLMPHAPASGRRVQAPPPPQQHKAVLASAVLQPQNRADVVVLQGVTSTVSRIRIRLRSEPGMSLRILAFCLQN